MENLIKRNFDVYSPTTKENPSQFIKTIEVEVETRTGQEYLTLESRQKIEEIRAAFIKS